MIYLLPLLISWTLGLLIVKTVLKNKLPGVLFTLFLSATIGLGASGFLTFSSFILFNQLVPWFVIVLNLGVTGVLAALLHRRGELDLMPLFRTWKKEDALMLAILLALTIPMIIFASLYPYGGWDAWGAWNVKARFLFLGGSEWTRMFDATLWRNQILYPFLLPLMNVWGWSFGTTPTWIVPMAMTCLIPFITAGILYSGIKELTGKHYGIIAPVWILGNMFSIQLGASQYSDLLLGLGLLGAITLFLMFQKTKDTSLLILAGMTLGMTSFTKVEGTALALLTLATATVLIYNSPTLKDIRIRAIKTLGITAALALIPVAIFILFYAPPESGIFINGLTSAQHPVTLERLWTILGYFPKEFTSMKWTGIWIILAVVIVLRGKKSFTRSLAILPVVLFFYALIFTATYFINTFYPIVWWLDTSLNRVIFAILPVATLWAFLAIDE